MLRSILLAAALALPAVSSAAGNPLDDSSWMMNLPRGSSCEVPPTLDFHDGKVTGDLGCNRFFSDVETDGNSIRFDNGGVTKKLCAPALMEIEKRMLDLVNGARSFRLVPEKTLTFYDEKGSEIMTLVPEKAGACD